MVLPSLNFSMNALMDDGITSPNLFVTTLSAVYGAVIVCINAYNIAVQYKYCNQMCTIYFGNTKVWQKNLLLKNWANKQEVNDNTYHTTLLNTSNHVQV